MNKIIIVCGPVDSITFTDLEHAIFLYKSRFHLEKRNYKYSYLISESLPDPYYASDVYNKLNVSLNEEAKSNQLAPLSLLYILRKLSPYLIYKYQLLNYIQSIKPEVIILSSDEDEDVTEALRDLCLEYNIEFQILKNPSDLNIVSYVKNPHYYHSVKGFNNSSIFVYLFALILRFKKYKILYEPYSNISNNRKDIFPITVDRITCWWNVLIQKIGIRKERFKTTNNLKLNRNNWSTFDTTTFHKIESAYTEYFNGIEINHYIKKIKLLRMFFRVSGVKRLITINDKVAPSRFLTYAAKSEGLWVDCMPHGLTDESLYVGTGLNMYSPNRMLAWNEGSSRRFHEYGMESCTVSRDDLYDVHRNCIDPKSHIISSLSVLYMLPENSVLSKRINEMESDVCDVLLILKELNIDSIELKLHPTSPYYLNSRIDMLNKVSDLLNIKFRINTDRILDKKDYYSKFDVVITAMSSSILELASENIPFIVYNTSNFTAGLFSDYKFDIADNPTSLKEILGKNKYIRNHFPLLNSIKEGVNLFDESLDESQEIK